jgi:hypothetical protein
MKIKEKRLLTVTLAIAVIAVSGCLYPTCDEDEAPDIEERQSVWQNLKVYSIYHERLPASPESMTPYDMFNAIHDTLKGTRYTEYLEDHFSGGTMFDPGTVFLEPIELTPSTAYFHLPEFSDTALWVFQLRRAELSRYQNIIIDVRDNGGGLLDVTDSIMGEFLPKGTGYIKTRYRRHDGGTLTGKTVDTVKTASNPAPALSGKKIAVLINEWSASASEILAAGLKDAANAFLIGDNGSYGKGIGQVIIPRGSGLKKLSITFMEISGLTSRTGQYHRIGLQPDMLPPDVKTEVDGHIPNQVQLEAIYETVEEEIEYIRERYPDVADATLQEYRRTLFKEYEKWYREIYYALKSVEPEFTFTRNVSKRHRAAETGAGRLRDAMAGIVTARAGWRPLGVVVIDGEDSRSR